MNKYLHNPFEKARIMDTTTDQENNIESKREIIRECLNEIIVNVESRLRAAGLSSTIFLTVPHSGDAVASMATPLDPSDDEWAIVTGIVCSTVSDRLHGLKLRGREMICAMANSPMVAADLTLE
jgi:hypothetical protein